MNPIYEQGSGKGIGYRLESFQKRFDQICAEHLADGRAQAFAFIFYDFTDQDLRHILKDQGVFGRLDRLSGRDLSLFYLHTGNRGAIDRFNAHFISELGVEDQAELPCVVFFRVEGEQVVDIQVAQLESADLIHSFRELYEVVDRYIKQQPKAPHDKWRALRWLKGGAKFISLEALRAAINRGITVFF